MGTIQINEKANLRALAISVIMGAIRELLFGTPIQQVMALEFITSSDFQFWADIGNMDLRITEVLTNPERIKKILLKKGKQHERV